MPRPKLRPEPYFTSTQVASRLGMDATPLVRWIERGVLPAPTSIDESVRYFAQEWIEKARVIVKMKRGE